MMNPNTVLIVDDHPLIAEVYENALLKIMQKNNEYQFEINKAVNCDQAISVIKQKSHIDLVFLDMSLPASSDGEFLSGEDIGILINDLHPNAKIIISTTYNDNYRVHNILKSVNPEGFLIKNDFNRKVLIEAIQSVLNGTPAYSKTALNILRTNMKHDYHIDKIDRDILYQLSIGTKNIELANVIPMSKGGIESRKRKLKNVFAIQKEDDQVLVRIAKEKGFI